MRTLPADYNLDQVRDSGEYSLVVKDVAHILTVKSDKDAKGRSYTIQTLTNVENGSELFRVKHTKGWTDWLGRLDSRAFDDVLSHINRAASGVEPATDKRDGLMSATDKAKLDGIPATADKTPNVQQMIDDVLKGIAKTLADTTASKNHAHDQYITHDELNAAFEQFMRRDEFTTKAIMKLIHEALKDYAVDYFLGYDKLALKDDITANKIKNLLGDIDAARLQGKSAAAFAQKDHVHDQYMPRPKRTSGKTARIVDSGAFIPNQENGRLEHYTNGGDHNFEAPQVATDMKVLITNGPKAGVINFVGFTEVIAPLTSKPGAMFLVHVIKIGPYADAIVKVLRNGDE